MELTEVLDMIGESMLYGMKADRMDMHKNEPLSLIGVAPRPRAQTGRRTGAR